MFVSSCAVGALVLVLGTLSWSCWAQEGDSANDGMEATGQPNAELLKRIDARSGGPFMESDAAAVVDEFGKSVLPTCVHVLESKEYNDASKTIAAMCLGKLGAPAAVPRLIHFVELRRQSPQKKPKDREALADYAHEVDSVTFALDALAWIGTKESIAFLKKAATVSYWQNRKGQTFFVHGSSSTFTMMNMNSWRRAALNALSFSGSTQAEAALRELDKSGDIADIAPDITSYLQENKRRMDGVSRTVNHNPRVEF